MVATVTTVAGKSGSGAGDETVAAVSSGDGDGSGRGLSWRASGGRGRRSGLTRLGLCIG